MAGPCFRLVHNKTSSTSLSGPPPPTPPPPPPPPPPTPLPHRLLLPRVRRQRGPSPVLGRPRRARRRPPQGGQRPRRARGRGRPLLPLGLLPPVADRRRPPAGVLPGLQPPRAPLRAGPGHRRQAAAGLGSPARRRAPRPDLAGRGRPGAATAARLRRG